MNDSNEVIATHVEGNKGLNEALVNYRSLVGECEALRVARIAFNDCGFNAVPVKGQQGFSVDDLAAVAETAAADIHKQLVQARFAPEVIKEFLAHERANAEGAVRQKFAAAVAEAARPEVAAAPAPRVYEVAAATVARVHGPSTGNGAAK